MKRISLLYIGLVLCGIVIKAQTIIIELKGKVTYIDDLNNKLNNAVQVDDTLTGTIIYYTNVTDNTTDSTIGDYYNTITPAGMVVKIDTLTFQTDTSDINLQVETVCRPSNDGGTAIVFRSYNNLFPAGNNYTFKTISWQLDDAFGTALKNDSLIFKIDLNKFEQYFGFTISADSEATENRYFIRCLITEITSTVRDINNAIIDTDSSVLIFDTIGEVDTTTESVADYDGNTYKTVKVGEQTWLRENLKCLHYADGTPIEDVHVYNNDEDNTVIYGRLYTWEAIMRGSSGSINIPSGVQGVCPVGWHIPSDNEWYTLIKYLGGTAEAGAKMKETDTVYWESPNAGAENTGFFSVRPAGYMSLGNYYSLGTVASFWSTAEYHEVYARYVFLDNLSTSAVIYNDGIKSYNCSIRCIKDDNITNTLYTINEDNYLDIYPNPASQILFINGLTQNVTVLIFDISGKIVINNQTVSNSIDVRKLKNGIYIIKIVDKNGVTTKKFVKL